MAKKFTVSIVLICFCFLVFENSEVSCTNSSVVASGNSSSNSSVAVSVQPSPSVVSNSSSNKTVAPSQAATFTAATSSSASVSQGINATASAKPTPSSSTSQLIPVNGNWSSWSDWSKCTKDCGNGTQVRTRACNNPVPSNGGKKCTEPDSETQQCNTKPCAERQFKVSFKVTSETFTEDLKDKSTTKYKELAKKFEDGVTNLFKSYSSFKRMVNTTFTEGSVVVAFVIIFGPTNSSSSSKPQDPATQLEQAVSGGSFAGVTVDKNSLKITENVAGTTITVWNTDESFCKTLCCGGTPSQVWQNRTCTAVSHSCGGILLTREVKCEKSSCEEKHCVKDSAGTRFVLSPLTIALAAIYTLWMLTV